jgi:hypothetical protein
LSIFKTSISNCGPCVKNAYKNQGDDKAGQFLASIMQFQFIIALVITEHILHSTVYLSSFLQDTDYDILEAIKESKTLIEMLRAERQDESV